MFDKYLSQLDVSKLERKYPRIRFSPAREYMALSELPLVMLVALTGTGKSTTLELLSNKWSDDIPTRREMADTLIIPSAQLALGEAIEPVSDREKRFFYTNAFREHISWGGSSLAYGSMYYQGDGPLISDGIRGTDEITYALTHFPSWRVIELWINPIERLHRISKRNDVFDVVNTHVSSDLTFLPSEYRDLAQQKLLSGDIHKKALSIMAAEASSYGVMPFDIALHDRHHLIIADMMSPQEVSQAIIKVVENA